MKFGFIAEEKVAFPIAVLCRVLAVSPSGYYASQGRPASLHARRDQDLSERIASIHHGSRRRYGSPRVHADLKASGNRVGCKRVARLMRKRQQLGMLKSRIRRWLAGRRRLGKNKRRLSGRALIRGKNR